MLRRPFASESRAITAASLFASGFTWGSADTYTADITFGPDGAMYVADGQSGVVWRVTPEPGTLCLLAVSALVGLRSRRRG